MDQDRRKALEKVVVDMLSILKRQPLNVRDMSEEELLDVTASLLAISRDRILVLGVSLG